jgi:thioredoxin
VNYSNRYRPQRSWVPLILLMGGTLLLGSCGPDLSGSPKGIVAKITSSEHFGKVLASSGNRLIVFDLYADWCGPCKKLSPMLDTLAHQYRSQARFYKINTDEHPALAREFSVSGIPLVVFVRKGRVVQSVVGLNPKVMYERAIGRHAVP